MKKNATYTAMQISPISDIPIDSVSGTGIMGFVVTYPDGSISNHVYHYCREDHFSIKMEVVLEYEKLQNHLPIVSTKPVSPSSRKEYHPKAIGKSSKR